MSRQEKNKKKTVRKRKSMGDTPNSKKAGKKQKISFYCPNSQCTSTERIKGSSRKCPGCGAAAWRKCESCGKEMHFQSYYKHPCFKSWRRQNPSGKQSDNVLPNGLILPPGTLPPDMSNGQEVNTPEVSDNMLKDTPIKKRKKWSTNGTNGDPNSVALAANAAAVLASNITNGIGIPISGSTDSISGSIDSTISGSDSIGVPLSGSDSIGIPLSGGDSIGISSVDSTRIDAAEVPSEGNSSTNSPIDPIEISIPGSPQEKEKILQGLTDETDIVGEQKNQ